MVQQLRALATLSEDTSLDPSTHVWKLMTTCISSSRIQCPLLSYTHTHNVFNPIKLDGIYLASLIPVLRR